MNLYIVVLPAKVLADGMHKIRIAISHNNETRYKVTRFRVPSPKNVKNGKVVGKDIDAEYINRQLNGMTQKMYKAYDEIPDAECYTCSQLLSLIESKINNHRPITFDEIADEWLAHKVRRCASGSIDIYKRSIDCFIECFGKGFILSTIRPHHITKYDDYLSAAKVMKKDRSEYNKPLSPTTINIRMRSLRTIIKYARDRKYIDFDIDPFIDYKERKENIRNIFLPVGVLRNIRDAHLEGNVDMCRDIFMLSFYLCGLNLGDMINADFSKDDITFKRAKTKTTRKDDDYTTFTIQPEARMIINKYIGADGKLHFGAKESKHTIANFLDGYMSLVAEAVGYKDRLIYYCARKSFAQYANELNIQERVIKYCLGNSIDQKNMIAYYTKTSKQMADVAIRKVLDFVASDLSEEELF